MNRSSKQVLKALVSLSVVGAAGSTAVLAASHPSIPMAQHNMVMRTKVTGVYPQDTTQINLATKDMMALKNKTITVQLVHAMGMSMMHQTLKAKYNAMKHGFVLLGGKMLVPGDTYRVSAAWANIPMRHDTFTIADLLKVKQLSANKLLLTYDRPLDLMSATAPGNYWITSNQAMASGIANLGKDGKVTPTNGLTKMDVTIRRDGMSDKKFIMTFKSKITPGVQYTVIPCAIDTRGSMNYMGANFAKSSMNMFTGDKTSM